MNKFTETPANKKSITKRKAIYGVGINDADYVTNLRIDGKKYTCTYYNRWYNMLKRCYSPAYLSNHPTYKGCIVCDDWLLFSNFKKWMKLQDWQGKELDKDLKIKGNKIYSPISCCFVPSSVNKLFTNSAGIRGDHPIGVCFYKQNGKYMSKLSINSKSVHLGYFDTPESASGAYLSAKRNYVIGLIKTNYYGDNITPYLLQHIIEER